MKFLCPILSWFFIVRSLCMIPSHFNRTERCIYIWDCFWKNTRFILFFLNLKWTITMFSIEDFYRFVVIWYEFSIFGAERRVLEGFIKLIILSLHLLFLLLLCFYKLIGTFFITCVIFKLFFGSFLVFSEIPHVFIFDLIAL